MSSVKILVVEDEKISAMAIRKMLSDLGYTVTGIAISGEEAIGKACEIKPDLVLMDIKLEGLLDGIETAETLTGLYNIPVVYITAYEDEQIFQRAKLTAPFGYMIKPFDERLLHINIEIAIYKHKVEQKLKEKALEEEKETYRLNLEAIFRSLEEGIISVDRDLNIIHLNPAIKNTCGFSGKDTGRPFRIFRKNSCDKCIEILEETIKRKQSVKIDRFECEQNNSLKKVFSISSVPLIDEKGLFSGAVLVIRDKTHIDVLEKELEGRRSFYNIIGKSKEIQKIYDLIEILSDVQSTVLITGESGTGKELVAEALHYKGIRRNKPLVKLNCTALSESLLESELFGHVKGAFTGAMKDKIGRFQKADGGTIFLDEIGNISSNMQLHLLRVLQEREFEQVGGNETIKVDVRVIAATNEDLREKVRTGQFREDLYYRLKVVEIKLPPLRERREDIILLTEFFIQKLNKKFKRNITGISSTVQRIFMEYSWPGNIRELEHTVEHAFILCRDSVITVEDLPCDLRDTAFLSKSDRIENEKQIIISALERFRWNKTDTARFLGMSRQTIYRKIKEYDI